MFWTPCQPQRVLLAISFVLAVVLAPGATAVQDAPAVEEQPTTAELEVRYAALVLEYDAGMKAFMVAYMKAQEAGEVESLKIEDYPPVLFFPRFDALADTGSLDAMFWILENTPDEQLKDYAKSLERAIFAAPGDDRLERIFLYLPPRVKSAGAAAALKVLGRFLELEDAGYRVNAELARANIEVQNEKDDAHLAEGIAALERLLALPETFRGKEHIAGTLFGAKYLRLGMIAPDFETSDADGAAFKLSDSRGKVTVVDFWGFW